MRLKKVMKKLKRMEGQDLERKWSLRQISNKLGKDFLLIELQGVVNRTKDDKALAALAKSLKTPEQRKLAKIAKLMNKLESKAEADVVWSKPMAARANRYLIDIREILND